jgi:hypothetical protein
MTMYKTLLLDTIAWDLVRDASGNIAVASPPYALAQDVASAIRTFLGELWYDTTQGVPYFQDVLGQLPPASVLIKYLEQAALTVPGVVSAQCVITSFSSRGVSGQVQFMDEGGYSNSVQFGNVNPIVASGLGTAALGTTNLGE